MDDSAFSIDRIFFKLVGNEDRYKILSLISDQIGLFALELLAVERRTFPP